jgi:hypothetical protein
MSTLSITLGGVIKLYIKIIFSSPYFNILYSFSMIYIMTTEATCSTTEGLHADFDPRYSGNFLSFSLSFMFRFFIVTFLAQTLQVVHYMSIVAYRSGIPFVVLKQDYKKYRCVK